MDNSSYAYYFTDTKLMEKSEEVMRKCITKWAGGEEVIRPGKPLTAPKQHALQAAPFYARQASPSHVIPVAGGVATPWVMNGVPVETTFTLPAYGMGSPFLQVSAVTVPASDNGMKH